ncbi:MAG: 5-dehydro-2-deoxygluconokinase [bacterium ADurb.Bin243]|nr:MAG: 5-dehydro-2-deoxygluconokinase [bacterium ADurb.Bin243]
MSKLYDVFGIGNPLMDIVVAVNDDFLKKLSITKGMFNLVDYDRLQHVFGEISNMKQEVEAGDSTANTMAGIANLGGVAAYQGCVGSDDYAKLYEEKTINQGIRSKIVHVDGHTGVAVALITPDSERSFATYLGVACSMKKEYLSPAEIENSKYLHLTGYQLEDPMLREMAVAAMKCAKSKGVLVSVDVADKGVIARNRDFIKGLLKEYVDIVFANEDESLALTGEAPDKAIHSMGELSKVACLKIGKEGSLIMEGGKVHKIPGYKAKPVDTTGAGDMYAAGVLFGLTQGFDIEKSGKIGSFSAARIVEVYGARPKFNLKELIKNI